MAGLHTAARPGSISTAAGLEVGRVTRSGEVAVLRLDWPSPGYWDGEHRAAFIARLDEIAAEPGLSAIVLKGRRLFEAGPGSAGAGAPFPEIAAAVSDCRVPVVAAIAGASVGDGLELALACAGRLAAPTATFRFPGVVRGRLPLSGAFERLPRLVGVEAAARLLVFGEPLDAATAAETGLVDAVAGQSLSAVATAFAASSLPPRGRDSRRRDEPEVAEAQLYAASLRLRQQLHNAAAPRAALRALEASARRPHGRAAAEILRIARALAASPDGQALAYAERAATLIPSETADTCARRLAWPMLREAVHLLDEGATPAQVDRCLTAYGFAEGPFGQSDRLGLAAVFTDGAGPGVGGAWGSYSASLDLMIDAGRGGAAASGWYAGQGDTGAIYDPGVIELLEASATFQRLHRGPVSDEHVLERCLFAAINGAASALEDRRDWSPQHVDAVWTEHLGFPRWRGGPLYQARLLGPARIAAALETWCARRNTAGAPSPKLAELA